MTSLNSFFILALISLFIFGIKTISVNLLYKYKVINYIEKLPNSSNVAITSLIGLFIFCIFSNLILLLPSIIFFINNSFTHFELVIELSLSILKLLFLVISLYGLIDLFNIDNLIRKKGTLISKFNTNKNLLLVSFLSSLLYLLASPKSISSGIFYDTGLYHLPFINHIIKFSIEPGLANLHFRYGFYGLSFFGQVPIQSFAKSSNYLSPSLNIGYFSIYLLYFSPFIRKISFQKFLKILKGDLTFYENIEEISIFYFLLSIIFYTGGILSSLSSYSLDLPLFICGSIIFHLILISFLNKNKIDYLIPIFWLSFFSPIIKLTGIITPIFSLSFIIISQINLVLINNNHKSVIDIFKYSIDEIRQVLKKLNSSKPFINLKLCTTLVIAIILIFIATNFIITGYPLFPKNILGPLHNFSLESYVLENITNHTMKWHRYQKQLTDSNFWFPIFFTTRNGLMIIIYWFLPSAISIILIKYIKTFPKKYIYKLNLTSLLIPLITIQFICFFNLIPLLKYYPWIPHCSIFILFVLINRLINLLDTNLNFIRLISLLLITFIIFNSIFSKSNFRILSNIPESLLKEPLLINPEFNYSLIKSKKRISLLNHNNEDIYSKIKIPKNGDQCWGIEPPCAISKENIKHYFEIN